MKNRSGGLSVALAVLIALSVCPSFAHDTGHHADTVEILRELQTLREDLNAFLIPAGISGRWQIYDETCFGYLPTWIEELLDDNDDDTVRITQYGNHLVVETVSGNGTDVYAGIIRGDYINFEREIFLADADEVVGVYAVVNATLLSRSRANYTGHLQILVGGDVYGRACTGEWRRIGN